MKYVVGFMFDLSCSNVALIRKQKPDWQKGLLNGIGGKIESEEFPIVAMCREFYEEAGAQTIPEMWKHFAHMAGTNNDGSEFTVDFFFTVGEPHKLKSQEAEQIKVVDCDSLWCEQTIGNLKWLIYLAKDFAKGTYPPKFVEARY